MAAPKTTRRRRSKPRPPRRPPVATPKVPAAVPPQNNTQRPPPAAPATATAGAPGGSDPVTMDGKCYSMDQIGAAMILAGFPRDPQVIANGMATVRPESGGCRVDNHICCWGPWQLNRADGGCSANEACAAGLMSSTKAALEKWNRGHCFACLPGPNPWQAGTDHAGTSDIARAKKLLAMDTQELGALVLTADSNASISPGGVDGVVDDAGKVITSVAGAIGDLVSLLKTLFQALFSPEFWLRVGKGLLGAVALIAGALILSRAALGNDLGVGERVGKTRRERAHAARYERDTALAADRAKQTAKGRTQGKAEAEEAARKRFFDNINKTDGDPPF